MTWHPPLARNRPTKTVSQGIKLSGATHLLSYFLKFEYNHFVRLVTSTMQVSKNLQCFILSIPFHEYRVLRAVR